MDSAVSMTESVPHHISGDSVASRTDWRPIKSRGGRFCYHSLERVSVERVEFNVRGLSLIVPLILMLLGFVSGFTLIAVGMADGGIFTVLGLMLGTAFFASGFYIFQCWTTPRVFDKDSGYFWKGNFESLNEERFQKLKAQKPYRFCKLDEIYAIQLLNAFPENNSPQLRGCELNLILKNGQRMHLIEKADLVDLRLDANRLGQFLGVPVWDGLQDAC